MPKSRKPCDALLYFVDERCYTGLEGALESLTEADLDEITNQDLVMGGLLSQVRSLVDQIEDRLAEYDFNGEPSGEDA